MPVKHREYYSQGRVLKGALIGFGNVAEHAHMPAFVKRNDFAIAAVIENDPTRQAAARSLLPDVPVYACLDELHGDAGIDFVDICTPPGSHAGLAAQALRQGFHVLCEKPFTEAVGTPASCSAEAGPTTMFVVNNWKFSPLWLKITELVKGGDIGRVREVSLGVVRTPGSGGGATDWRARRDIAGGGILLDHGWHQFYLLTSVIDQAPEAVSAVLDYDDDAPAIEHTADVTVLFPSTRASIHLTWRGAVRRNYGVIRGDRGTVTFDDDHLIVHAACAGAVRYDFPEPLSRSSHHPDWMDRMLDAFRMETTEPAARGTNLAEVRQCALLVTSAYRSAHEGSRLVRVDRVSGEWNNHAAGKQERQAARR